MVPKLIHHIIGPSLNQLVEECLESWQCLKGHGFNIIIWNDSSLEKFLSRNHYFALEAFKRARNHGEAADIARYLLLYTYGGIYADWDIELLDQHKFIESLSDHPNGYLLIDPLNNTLASEFFCALQSDPYLMSLSKDIVSLYNNGKRNQMETPQYSGPFRMRDSLKLHQSTLMDIIPVKSIFAYDYAEIINPPEGPITQPLIHYWMHSWVK